MKLSTHLSTAALNSIANYNMNMSAVENDPADDILRERYAFALDKIHILEDSIQLYKKLIEQNDKHN